jgi:hypothetical protein
MPLLFAILSAGWLAFFLLQPFNGATSDFPQFYAPASLIVSGHGTEAYQSEKVSLVQHQCFPTMGTRSYIPAYLPPPSLVWFIGLGYLPPEVAAIVWKIVQVSCLVASVLLLRNAFGLKKKSVFWLVAILCMSGPAFAAIKIEQVSMLLLCALSAAIWALRKNKPLIAAVALSFLMLKPQEGLPFLIYLLGARRYKVVAYTACMLSVMTIFVYLLIGAQGISDYVHLGSSAVEQSPLMQSELGPTVRGQLLRLMPGSTAAIAVVSALVSLCSMLFIFVSGRRFASHRAWLEAGLLVAIPLGLVTCYHMHSYELVLLTPTVVTILCGPLQHAIPPLALLCGFMLFGVFMSPFYMYIHWDYLMKEHWILNPHFFALLIIAAATAFLPYRYPEEIVPGNAQ